MLIPQARWDEGAVLFSSTASSTSQPLSTGSAGQYLVVTSGTSAAHIEIAAIGTSLLGTASARPMVAPFGLSADTSPSLNVKFLSTSLDRPWSDLIRKQQQAKKNYAAVELIKSWLHDQTNVDEEKRHLEEIKTLLDATRTSNRKLFR